MPDDTKPMLFMSHACLNASSEAAVQKYMADLEQECMS
jgi:hypothetical protein